MTAWILARVSSCTIGERLMTRETVFFDTPAMRAISLMVTPRPLTCGSAERLSVRGRPSTARCAFFFLVII
jgi:hypothetical protein